MTKLSYPKKRFGQNFLQDPIIIDALLALITPNTTNHFIEIGPGRGALTFPIAKTTLLDAIEIDRELAHQLKQQAQQNYPHLTVHQADALSFNFSSIEPRAPYLRLIGNLPYNISTPLLFHTLGFITMLHDIHFMLQKEVVDRITAPPNTKAYGRLSVMVQYHCTVKKVLDIPPSAFYPSPKVQSAFLKMIPKPSSERTCHNIDLMQKIVLTAFNMRRKTIRNSLKNYISPTQMEYLSIDPNTRAENITPESYVRITNYLHDTKK